MPDRRPTVLETFALNVGVIKAGQVLAFVSCWSWAMERRADEWPTANLSRRVELYREVWLDSDSTAWRKLRLYRKAYPGMSDPSDLVVFLRAQGFEVKSKIDASGMAAVRLAAQAGPT